MKKNLIAVVLSSLAFVAQAQDEHHQWAGQIELPNGQQMPLEFETFTNNSLMTANVRSPAQGTQNIPVTDLMKTETGWSLVLPTLGASLELKQEKSCLQGELNQGMALPVTLCPVQSLSNDEYLAVLPEQVVEFPNVKFQSADGTWLSGTLYQPANNSKAPVVILAGGSGPIDRDASFAGKKPYRNLGIELAKQGVALFTFDKRGVRRSGGNYSQATVEDYARDSQAAFDLIKSMNSIQPEKIGLAGHSEGATVVAITAAEVKADFVISLGGVGLNGVDAIVLQDKTESMGRGATEQQAQILQKIAADYYRIVLNAKDDEQRLQQAKALLSNLNDKQREVYQKFGVDAYTLDINNVNDKALFSILTTDPTKYWQKVCAPVLVLNGDKDVQVPAAENVQGIKQSILSCPHPANKFVVLPDYNHMFQPTTDGNVKLYASLPEGFDENTGKIIATWIYAAGVSSK
ncbi:hypothetical protein SAMN06297280_0695 [Arsukibacterium tuosuense]|uniref:AB hydrolase-1 domain-containing protein n=1 Tax=Arsukibacterium tuosuense TaxID=1323745 RepID=A0A285IAN6_9GAMM|nr:alpha/beta hydrolase [Arsukibacterium tuosuense]SNY44126.1 hypothetical protein SAMN06297280_0695 [Arsukibacterium tuosuense]